MRSSNSFFGWFVGWLVVGGGGSGCDGLTDVCIICGCSWDMLIVECALRNESGSGGFGNSRKKSFYVKTIAGEGGRRSIYVCTIYGLYENKNMF